MSNKSLFNKTLFKKDMKIIGGITVAYFVVLFIMMPFMMTQTIYNLKQSTDTFAVGRALQSLDFSFYSVYPITILYAIIIALLLFASEKSTKSFEMLASLPFSRKQIFFNKILVGLSTLLLPIIFCFGLTHMIVSSDALASSLSDMTVYKYSFLLILTMTTVIFSYFVMFSMMFGNTLVSFLFGSICVVVPAGIAALFEVFLSINNTTNGAISEFFFRFTPMSVFMSANTQKNSYIYLIAFAVIFIAMSIVLFYATKIEKITEFLTFKCLEIPFKIIFFICSGLLSGVIVGEILGLFTGFVLVNKAVGLIIGLVLGYLLPKMMINKSRVA